MIKPAHPKVCRECGSARLSWTVQSKGPSDVQDGRIRMSEVSVIGFIACDECSETLYMSDETEITQILNNSLNNSR